jgi:hypothetical protein
MIVIPANSPRFDHNPATGESLGLLVEEARTNLLQYSEQFDNAYWTKDKVAVTSNAATAPDGTLTADLLYTITSGSANVSRNLGAVSSAPYTSTIYLKSAGFTWAYMIGPQANSVVYFNLISGTVGTVGAGLTASISSVGNGWYRCSVTQTATFTSIYAGPADANGTGTSTASGTSGIYIWGAQLEAGAFPTSYIPTTTATVTRSADICNISGSNFSSWYRQDEGTVFAETSAAAASGNFGIMSFNASGSVNNRIDARIASLSVVTAGGTQVATLSNSLSQVAGQSYKTGVAYAVDNYGKSTNGSIVATDTSGAVPTGINQLDIGSVENRNIPVNQPIRRLVYWPVRLPDAQLQALTK